MSSASLSLSVAVWGPHPLRSLLELRDGLALATYREVDVVAIVPPKIAVDSSPAGISCVAAETFHVVAARNTAASAARGDLLTFALADDAALTGFLRRASGLLDARDDLSFVTSWPAHVPSGDDERPRACDLSMLMCRPWFVEIPILLRRDLVERLGGFDDEVAGFEMVDLLLRAQSRGFTGVVLEDAVLRCREWLGADASRDPSATAAYGIAERLLRRHRSVIDRELAAVICGKERMIRQLDARYRRADARRTELKQRIEGLDHERALIEARLAERPGR